MANVKTYHADPAFVSEDLEGAFVLLSDYVKAENELYRLNHFGALHWQEQWLHVIEQNNQKDDEILKLKRQVRQLTEGGDELLDIIAGYYCPEKGLAFDIWKAAKEGRLPE